MKTLFVNHSSKNKAAQALFAIVFFAQGILNLLREETWQIIFGSIQIGFSIFWAIYTYSIIKPDRRFSPRIQLGDSFIQLKKNFFSRSRTILLEDIKLLQIKPEALGIMLKQYDFTHEFFYSAENKNEIINEIHQYADHHNIPIERISYQNY